MSSNRPDLKFSDISEERGFYRRFISLPEKAPSTLRIVDKGEYYTVVGNDAIFVAENIYHTQSVLKDCKVDANVAKQFNEPCKYVTVSAQMVSNLLKVCLMEMNYKIEVYDKSWKLSKSASPGNIEQVVDLMNVAIDASIVISSLKLKFNSQDGFCVIGVSFIDTSNYKIGMLDIIDNEVYSNLESFLIQLGVRECLIPDLVQNENVSGEIKKITGVIDRCGCVATLVKNSEFSEKDVDIDLAKLVGDELSLSLPKFSSLSLGACGALLNYLQIGNEDNQQGKYEIIEHSLKEFVKLDASAIKALNLFPQNSAQNVAAISDTSFGGSGSGGKVSSLFQLLNNCKTNAGVRMLNQWLKQPLTDLSEILNRHTLVEYMIDQLELRQILQTEQLPLVPDIRRITKKLNKNGNLEDVLKLYEVCKRVPEITQVLSSFLDGENIEESTQELITSTWLQPLLSHMDPLGKLQEMVETTVDLEVYESSNQYMIKVEFNEELALIREQLDELQDRISSIHTDSAEDLGFDPDKKLKLENHHIHGWCMRLTRNDAKELRKHKKYLELSTVKAGIYFSTKELKEIANETASLQKAYEKQQMTLVKEIVNITLTYSPVLEKLSLVLAHLDVLCSFAHISSYAPVPYVRPKMHDFDSSRKTRLIASRHPVLEMQDDMTFIANDVDLDDTGNFIIITGPNMGGKSTYIRQVGVISLMAQIGCFVPCEEADIAIVDAILCRVGAGDSQLKGVSTFMVEMLETASILKNATTNSLIIVDELGRGTSTYDGFGLAWAIAEHIASKIKCFALFATHFHELTSLSNEHNNVKNMHVVAHIERQETSETNDDDEITLLYKVEPGISDQSFGIHVAEVVNFPQKIVKMAKRKANELEELKQYNENGKRPKLTSLEISEGGKRLKTLLRNWVTTLEQQGLTDPQKLSEEEAQQKIQDLLRDLSGEEANSDDKYLKYIKEILL